MYKIFKNYHQSFLWITSAQCAGNNVLSTKVSIDSAIICHFRSWFFANLFVPQISWSCATVSVSDTEISFHCLPTRIHTSGGVNCEKWKNLTKLWSSRVTLPTYNSFPTAKCPTFSMTSGRIGAIVHPVAQKSGKNAAETSPRWCSDRVEESGDHTLYEGSDFEDRRSRPGFFEVQVLCVCCMCMCAWRMSHN